MKNNIYMIICRKDAKDAKKNRKINPSILSQKNLCVLCAFAAKILIQDIL